MANNLADVVRNSIINGFEAQATAHGAALHKAAVAARARDPLIAFLIDTFTRQVRERGIRAQACQGRGERLQALRMAESAMAAAENLRRVREAVNS
jgi:hypothetical protein